MHGTFLLFDPKEWCRRNMKYTCSFYDYSLFYIKNVFVTVFRSYKSSKDIAIILQQTQITERLPHKNIG